MSFANEEAKPNNPANLHTVKEENSCTLINLFKFLEDPKYPCLGPHLRFLGFSGLWHPNMKSRSAQAKQVLFLIIITFFFSQYIRTITNFNIDSLTLLLHYSPFHLGIVKTCLFQKDYKIWEQLIEYVSSVERAILVKKDNKFNAIIYDYIIRSRRMTYFFWTMAFVSNFGIFSGPYQKNHINENGTSVYNSMFDGYTPFNQREPPGYYASMVIQTIFGNILSFYIVGWDTLVTSMMIFFAGQLRVTRLYCEQIIADSDEQNRKNIADCHRFYITLINYQKVLNSLISQSMFIYLIVISVNLGVNIIQIVEALAQSDLGGTVSGCMYLMACLIQLLLFYWHGNEVTEESRQVNYGVFESNWMTSDKKMLKEVALLQLSTNKKIVFTAGPFNELSLSTFVAILRGSYSFFTLMKETKD